MALAPQNKTDKKDSVAARALMLCVRFYQKALSPLKPACCRYVPSCSSYAIEAIKVHGAIKGAWLAFNRILRCQPFGGSGFDPVPPAGISMLKKSKPALYLILLLFSLFFSYSALSATITANIENIEQKQVVVSENVKQRQLNAPTRFLRWIIKLYQDNISPLMPGKCRFKPTCSAYGMEALEKHGALKGSWLTLKRILRCNPWGGHGDDPVPEPTENR